MATIRDIAKVCGVSAMTVSAVINKRRGAASPETQRRVMQVVEEMGYHPNAIARGLSRRYMDTIGVILAQCEGKPVASDRYFGPILDGIFDATKCHAQRTVIMTEDNWENAFAKVSSFFDGHCDGLVFILPTIPTEYLSGLQKRKIPFVVIGESRTGQNISLIDVDNVMVGYDATSYLLSLGHRRIAHFSGSSRYLSSKEREEGYRRALAAWGVEVDERLIFQGEYNAKSGYAHVENLLADCGGHRPTAIFCGDNSIALGALEALKDARLKVPDDISLIGVNNDRESATATPPLTTIDQPLYSFGQRAVEMVLAQIREGVRPGERALIRGDMIVRGSLASLSSYEKSYA